MIAKRLAKQLDWVVVAALTALYLGSFDASSPLFRVEVFGEDSQFIWRDLAANRDYTWNRQNHLLHHVLVGGGYAIWKVAFGASVDSAFAFLKTFSAACGLAYLVVLRSLLADLRLDARRRALLLFVSGISVSSWFHFSVFETHCAALPALAVYLRCVGRLRGDAPRTNAERAAFVASLVVAGLLRVDLWRFAIVSAALPLLPVLAAHRRTLLVDLGIVALAGVAATAVLARAEFGVDWSEAPATVVERWDRGDLEDRLRTFDNFTPTHLLAVARAESVYTFAMPASARTDAAPDARIGTFREPLSTAFSHPAALPALLSVVAVLLVTAGYSLVRATHGDPLHTQLWLQWVFGWLLYTWFNPWEPFLWSLEFHGISMVAVAAAAARASQRTWWAAAALALLLVVHNGASFYWPLR